MFSIQFLQPVYAKILYMLIIIHWGTLVEYDWSDW